MFKTMIAALIAAAALAAPCDAEAGRLGEGVFGVKWGEQPPLEIPDCRKTVMTGGYSLYCQKQLGEGESAITVSAEFGYGYDRVFIVQIIGDGYRTCDVLLDSLNAAWGPSFPVSKYLTSKMDDRTWSSGDGYALWNWNRYNEKCNVVALSLAHNTIYTERKKAAQAAGASGI